MPRKSRARQTKKQAKTKRTKVSRSSIFKGPIALVTAITASIVALTALINAVTPIFPPSTTATRISVQERTTSATVQPSPEPPTPTPTEQATDVPQNVIAITFGGAIDANYWKIQACEDVLQDQSRLGEYGFLVPDDTSRELHNCGLEFNGELTPIRRVSATVRLDSGIGSASYVGIFATCGLVKLELLLDRYGVRPFVSGREGKVLDDFGEDAQTPLEEQLVIEWTGELIRFSVAGSPRSPAEYECTEYPETVQVGIRTLGYFGINAAILEIEVSD